MAYTLNDLEKIFAALRRRLRLLEIQSGNGVIKTGLATNRPITPTTSSGLTTSYYSTDTKTLSIWNTQNSEWDESIFS